MTAKKLSQSMGLIWSGLALLLLLAILIHLRFAWSRNTSIIANSSSIKNCTTNNGTINEQCAEDYIGLSLTEAVNKAEDNGLFPKVTLRDSESQGFTDFGSAPIYFEIEKDTVTLAYFEHDRPTFSYCTKIIKEIYEEVCTKEYIGLSEKKAQTKARVADLKIRVIERDGKINSVTLDYSRSRINFAIRDNEVVEADIY